MKYSKPLMAIEKFLAEEFCTPCNWQGQYTSGGAIYSSSTHLYHDTDDDGHYDSGEQVNTPSPPSNRIFTFSFEENEALGYVELSNSTNQPHLLNIIPDGHNYYIRYHGRNDEYAGIQSSLYVLKTTNNKVYYFSGNQWTFTKLQS